MYGYLYFYIKNYGLEGRYDISSKYMYTFAGSMDASEDRFETFVWIILRQ